MTREEFARTVAEMVAGLQVPVSMSDNWRFGAALEPWQKLLHLANHGFGWTNANDLEAEFRKVLDLKPKVPEREPSAHRADLPPACSDEDDCHEAGLWGATGIMPPGHVWQWRNAEHTSGYLAHLREEMEHQ